MSYVALYRSYRPKTFAEVVGQKVIIKTLQNALKNDKIGHAYIFSGPRGTGKTSVAKILAKAVNCKDYPVNDPCGKCSNCAGIEKNEIGDIIEIDAASNNGVDEIREIRDKAKYSPSVGKYKVYIIDEVHMLTPGAFNALLKTLEEPPKHVIFILATTEIHKIPATILSRCQRFDFKNIDEKDIEERLKEICKRENIDIEESALRVISQNAEGGLRDALSLLDQVISFSDSKVKESDVHSVAGSLPHETLAELLLAINKKESASALSIIDNLINNGKEISRIVSDLIIALRDCLLEKEDILTKKRYSAVSGVLTIEKIYYYIDVLNKLQNDIKNTQQKRAYIEVALFKMMNHKIVQEIDQVEMILSLKKEIEGLKEDINKRPVIAKDSKKIAKPLVTVDDIAQVLYNGDKNKKTLLQKGWPKLSEYPDANFQAVAKLLGESELMAVSATKMVVTYDDLKKCKYIMNKDIKKDVLKIINSRSQLIDDFYAISGRDFDALSAVFKNEYDKNTNPRPILPSIDLKIYEEEKADGKELKSDTVRLAEEYFGADKVKIKKEITK